MATHNIANDAALDTLINSMPWTSAASTTIRLATGVYATASSSATSTAARTRSSSSRRNPEQPRGHPWLEVRPGTNRGNFAHLPNASSNNSTFRNMTFQWLTFAPELYTSARPSGGGAARSRPSCLTGAARAGAPAAHLTRPATSPDYPRTAASRCSGLATRPT